MESRGLIVLATWISLSIISAVFIWIGGVSLGNYIFVGLLIFLALGVTFAVGFGLEPEKKPEIELLNEIKNIRSKLDELTKEVEEIKKAIEE